MAGSDLVELGVGLAVVGVGYKVFKDATQRSRHEQRRMHHHLRLK